MGIDDIQIDGDGQQVQRTNLRQILNVLVDKKASYPSEVSARTDLSEQRTGAYMREMERAGVLEVLSPKMKLSDQRLLDRRSELWERGVQGRDEFRQRNWYGLNSDIDWRFKVQDELRFVDEFGRTVAKWCTAEERDSEIGAWETPTGKVLSYDVEWTPVDRNFMDTAVDIVEAERDDRTSLELVEDDKK